MQLCKLVVSPPRLGCRERDQPFLATTQGHSRFVCEIMPRLAPGVLEEGFDLEFKEDGRPFAICIVIKQILWKSKYQMFANVSEFALRLWNKIAALNIPVVTLNHLAHYIDVLLIKDDNAGTNKILDLLERTVVLCVAVFARFERLC
ncbi:hypothetical protein BC350_14425 [Ralstonia pseudosolanacearum]|nr:hypothetical protein BC350_14425 [Ralstonia pseudosolanacearum]